MSEKATISTDIVIYGGSFAAVAAATRAAAQAPSKKIVVIVPYLFSSDQQIFGSIGTVGGQNYFDTRTKDGELYTKGSFELWYNQFGQFYNTSTMAVQLNKDVIKYSNITVYRGYDIKTFSALSSPFRLSNVTICSLVRNSSGVIAWGSTTHVVSGTVFVDASDDGRLARIANSAVTVGRYDWPASRLDADERGATGRARQQAASLMFKVKGVTKTTSPDMTWVTDPNTGVQACFGGTNTYKTDSVIVAFNNTYGPKGYALKPINAAQNGHGSSEWWINALLVFNVDGRAYNRDIGTSVFPSDRRSDYKTVDDAWVDAKKFLKNTPDFLKALRRFAGFSKAEFVLDANGDPTVGAVMYLRETVHMAKDASARANGTENTNYQLTANACNSAGATSTTGMDTPNFATRIGLNFYWSDINAYQFSDLKNASGSYIWGGEIGAKLRPDLGVSGSTPSNPVYVPYHALTTAYVANLLIPGYAAGISSFGWSECRVIPNQCVLGDAAGIAAAYAVNNGKHPLQFTTSDIASIQTKLNAISARLNK